jgi:hypothetical protein
VASGVAGSDWLSDDAQTVTVLTAAAPHLAWTIRIGLPWLSPQFRMAEKTGQRSWPLSGQVVLVAGGVRSRGP